MPHQTARHCGLAHRGLSSCTYGYNSPLKYTDPSGHVAVCITCPPSRGYRPTDDGERPRRTGGDIPVQIVKPLPKINVPSGGSLKPQPKINIPSGGTQKPQPKINIPGGATGAPGPFINIPVPDPFGQDKVIAAKETNDEKFGSTLEPGPFAGDSIPAHGSDRNFTDEERAQIDAIGYATGCHTCGTKDPGTTSGHFIPDHQPPNALNVDGQSQRLYPHCLSCSLQQGGEVRVQKLRDKDKSDGK
jgi:hypothetical protein